MIHSYDYISIHTVGDEKGSLDTFISHVYTIDYTICPLWSSSLTELTGHFTWSISYFTQRIDPGYWLVNTAVMLYSRIECNSQVQEAKIPFIFTVGKLLFNIKPFKDRGSVRLLWSEQLTVYDPQSFSAVVPNLVFMKNLLTVSLHTVFFCCLSAHFYLDLN